MNKKSASWKAGRRILKQELQIHKIINEGFKNVLTFWPKSLITPLREIILNVDTVHLLNQYFNVFF